MQLNDPCFQCNATTAREGADNGCAVCCNTVDAPEMTSATPDVSPDEARVVYFVPSRDDVANIRVGALALNCFGRLARVTTITALRNDIGGRLFCCYYTETGTGNGACSMSMKEGELVRSVHVSCRHTSAQIDAIERDMRARGSRLEIK